MKHAIPFRIGAALAIASALLGAFTPALAAWIPNGVPMCTAPSDQNASAMIPDQNGGAILAWHDPRGADYDIYAQRVDSAGVRQWGDNGVVVASVAGDQYNPVLSSDGGGGAIVFWIDLRSGTFDVYAQRISALGVPQWTAGGVPICTAPEGQSSLAVVQDRFNFVTTLPGAIVAWGDSRTFNTTFSDIYVQHVDTNGGGLWTAPSVGVALCTASGNQTTPVIATDGSGTVFSQKGAIVAWIDRRNGSNSDIYARRVDAAGTAQWAANGIAACAATGPQDHPCIAYVNPGVIIAWTDGRDMFDGNVYAQRLDVNGTPQWPADGVLLCTDPGNQNIPVIAPNGTGGAVVAWRDARTGNLDVYLQNVDANGMLLWGASGIPVTATNGGKVNPHIIPNNFGAILAWEDYRNGHVDIYAQRVDANGNLLWGADGVRVCGASNNQFAPRCANTSNPSMAIVAWSDQRTGLDTDIYANRVLDPMSVDVSSDFPSDFNVALLSSNPAHGDVMFGVHLPRDASLAAEVFDPRGRLVRRLAGGVPLSGGSHVLIWDGKDDAGAAVRSGVYFLRARTAGGSRVVKLVQMH